MAVSENGSKQASGYHVGDADTVISVDEVTRQAAEIAQTVTIDKLDNLADGKSFLTIENLCAGYGKMEILHDLSLRVGKGQYLCQNGPKGACKTNIKNSKYS